MKRCCAIFLLAALMSFIGCPAAVADETALFSTVAPDALIVMDLSGSMSWNPAGGNDVWGDAALRGAFLFELWGGAQYGLQPRGDRKTYNVRRVRRQPGRCHQQQRRGQPEYPIWLHEVLRL